MSDNFRYYTINTKKYPDFSYVKYVDFYSCCLIGKYTTFKISNKLFRNIKIKKINNLYLTPKETCISSALEKSIEGYILDSHLGVDFNSLSDKAKEYSKFHKTNIIFNFNDILCVVNEKTNLNNLYRYYCDSHLMEWNKIGPICFDEYDDNTKKNYEEKYRLSEERRRKRYLENKLKEEKDKEIFHSKIDNIEIEFSDKDGYYDWKKNNLDTFGACVFEYAEGWAKLMQYESKILNINIDLDFITNIGHKLSFEQQWLGLSGSMYYAAVSILSNCWKYGDALKEYNNLNK